MMQDVLNDMGGIGIFGIISVCLFFLVFGGALLWAFRLKKTYLTTMSSLPLRSDTSDPGEKGDPCHE